MGQKHFASMLFALCCTDAALANEAHRLLMEMPEAKRGYALSRLLQKSGEKCPEAKRTFYQGSDKTGNAFWNVECAGGSGPWVVQINNDRNGSTRILECSVLKAVNAGTCFTKFK